MAQRETTKKTIRTTIEEDQMIEKLKTVTNKKSLAQALICSGYQLLELIKKHEKLLEENDKTTDELRTLKSNLLRIENSKLEISKILNS